MFEKILIPLDGSKLAEAALPYGEEISRAFGSEIILLHVCNHECQNYEHMPEIYLTTLAETMNREAKEDQQEDFKINVLARIEEGKPSETINKLAEKNAINLIIMTSVGSSGRKVGMLGKVANQVSGTMKIPVLLIQPWNSGSFDSEKQIIKRILVTLDGSDSSKLALPIASKLAKNLKIPLVLFRMANSQYPNYGDPAPFVDYVKLTANEEKKVRAEMTFIEIELKENYQDVTWEVISGNDAAHEIIKMSKMQEECLVVMSTHGWSDLSHWAFGSVAEKVLHQIERPLLLVPARSGSVD
jgi:nucleotide-binding universal stress UspA family protein